MKRAWLSTGALFAVLLPFLALASPGQAQTSGVWEELANTRFDQSAAVCGKPGAPPAPLCVPIHLNAGNDIQASIFASWSAGAFDTKRRRFVLAATGGHYNWAGNQVIAFNLPTATTPGGWVSRRGPSMDFPVYLEPSVCPYPDYTPCSVHSYDAVAYLPDQDVIWSGGGYRWYTAQPTWNTWWFTSGNEWVRRAERSTSSSLGMASVWDPVSKRLLYRDHGWLRSYDPVTDRTTVAINLVSFPDSWAEEMSTAALDVQGRKFYRIKRKQSTFPAGIALKLLDLANLVLYEQTVTATGDLAVETMRGGSLIFHAGRLVALGKTADGLNSALYTLNPTGCGLSNQPACIWTRYRPPSGPLPPLGDSHGIWKKFFLDTDGVTFYFVTGWSKNVWRMKSPWAAPVPPPIPPPVPGTSPR
jgi:hypothetical protein